MTNSHAHTLSLAHSFALVLARPFVSQRASCHRRTTRGGEVQSLMKTRRRAVTRPPFQPLKRQRLFELFPLPVSPPPPVRYALIPLDRGFGNGPRQSLYPSCASAVPLLAPVRGVLVAGRILAVPLSSSHFVCPSTSAPCWGQGQEPHSENTQTRPPTQSRVS